MSPLFETVYLRHAVASFEKQLRLAEVVGERGWSFSMDDGALTFAGSGGFLRRAPAMTFHVQLLGSASDVSSSWLWSWANEASDIPPALTQDAARLRDSGEVPEWSTAGFSLDFGASDDHRVAMTARGVLNADAYYRGPYEAGAAYFLLRDARLKFPAPDAVRLLSVFTQAISTLPLADHRAAWQGFLASHGVSWREENGALLSTVGNQRLRAEFDGFNRLTALDGGNAP